MDLARIAARVAEIIQYGLLASFGATANYLYITVIQGKRFVWVSFFANIFISFFVGNLAGEFIDAGNKYKDGLIMACGYCAFPVLQMLEVKVREWLAKLNPT